MDDYYLYRYHISSPQQSEWVDNIYEALTHLQNFITAGCIPVFLHEYTYEAEWQIEEGDMYGERRLFTLEHSPAQNEEGSS